MPLRSFCERGIVQDEYPQERTHNQQTIYDIERSLRRDNPETLSLSEYVAYIDDIWSIETDHLRSKSVELYPKDLSIWVEEYPRIPKWGGMWVSPNVILCTGIRHRLMAIHEVAHASTHYITRHDNDYDHGADNGHTELWITTFVRIAKEHLPELGRQLHEQLFRSCLIVENPYSVSGISLPAQMDVQSVFGVWQDQRLLTYNLT